MMLHISTLSFGITILALMLCGTALSYAYIYPFVAYILPLIISLPIYIISNNTAPKRALFSYIFAYAFIFNNSFWVFSSFDMAPDNIKYLKYISALLTTGIMAFPYSIIGLALQKAVIPQWLQYVALWCIIERAIGIFFPYIAIGNIAIQSQYLSQCFGLFGMYGMSFIIMVWSSILCAKKYAACFLVSIMLCYAYGYAIINSKIMLYDNQTEIAIIQPNLKHHMGDKTKAVEWFQKLTSMTENASINRYNKDDFQYVIWPEAALPYVLNDNIIILPELAKYLSSKQILFTGHDTIHYSLADKLYNAISVIDEKGSIIGSYRKNLLVPFGEYIPLRSIIGTLISKFSYGIMDFSSGNNVSALQIERHNIIPIICYESAFSWYISEFHTKADFILNITNDSWFGATTGPLRNWNTSRIRAIEYGLPLIRASTSGISGIISPYGETEKLLDLNTEGIVYGKLPKPRPIRTLYSATNAVFDKIWLYMQCIVVIITILSRKTKGKHINYS